MVRFEGPRGNRVIELSITHGDWWEGPSWHRDTRCRTSK